MRTPLVLAAFFATACADALPLGPPGVAVEILEPIELTDAARFPEEDAMIASVSVGADTLVFDVRGAMERPFVPGDIIAGVQDGGYLRRAVSVTSLGDGRVEVTTVPAQLVELVGSGHFRIHMVPGAESWQPGATREPLELALFPDGFDVARGCELSAPATVALAPDVRADLEMELEIHIEWAIRGVRGSLVAARVETSGSIAGSLAIEATRDVTLTCGDELHAPVREWTTAIVLGPLPLVLSHSIGPTATLEASGTIGISEMAASAQASLGLRAGARYERTSGWRPIWEPTAAGSVSLDAPQAGDLSLNAELSAGIEYRVKLYDVFGPSTAITRTTAASFSATESACGWNAEVSTTRAVSIGARVDVPLFDLTLAEFSHEAPLGVPHVVASGSGSLTDCMPCGASGAACCEGSCDTGLACVAGVCQPCGSLGGPCCAGICDASRNLFCVQTIGDLYERCRHYPDCETAGFSEDLCNGAYRLYDTYNADGCSCPGGSDGQAMFVGTLSGDASLTLEIPSTSSTSGETMTLDCSGRFPEGIRSRAELICTGFVSGAVECAFTGARGPYQPALACSFPAPPGNVCPTCWFALVGPTYPWTPCCAMGTCSCSG